MLLLSLLALADMALGLSTNVSTADTIIVQGGSSSDAQRMYDIMGGTFNLPDDVFGSEAHVSALVFANSTDELAWLHGITPNGTDWTSSSDTSSLEERGYTEKIKIIECADPPEDEYRLLSYASERWVWEVTCAYIEATTAAGASLIGVVLSKIECGADLEQLCEAFFAVTIAEAGYYIGAGARDKCTETKEAILAKCYRRGGVAEIEIVQTEKTFMYYGVATKGDTTTIDCDVSGRHCKKITCDGQCQG
ncbi:hypothetical protein ASPZODRAFT_2111111 [Penicilliopsis zonata CBS 506.65]|uniref:Ecp2 effector protein domain-containing protein n=1 Tax=Penicilliopsis zonata CBS 506.65 TaxID=1073090 RepID=A0A1L9SDL9_9EURO|nr:hypothetical protein ASPZODRAFT_2111111 [Penicilliopsis zonata CBS 506.65]OJJ45177.1 hypothetical protein ASPZODRAFT_2111111 [Penicilliopsis zonata CBS 506.65]